MINLYILFEIKSWRHYFDNGFTLRNSLTKNTDLDKRSYSGYGILFGVRGTFSLPNESFGKNVIIIGAGISSSVHVDNKREIS